jgi:hypothetical protein
LGEVGDLADAVLFEREFLKQQVVIQPVNKTK